MLARCYGVHGMAPNSREIELLSLRQYLLLEAGFQQNHQELWSIVRGGLGQGTYYDIYGLQPSDNEKNRSRKAYEDWKARAQRSAPGFFEDINMN